MIPIYSIKEDNHEMLDEVILIYAISEIIAFSFEFPNRQYFRGLDADLCFIFCFLSANPISKCLCLLLLCSYSFERWDSKKHPFPGLIFNSSVRHPSKWLNYFLLLGLAYQKHFSVPARKYFSRRVLEKWRRNVRMVCHQSLPDEIEDQNGRTMKLFSKQRKDALYILCWWWLWLGLLGCVRKFEEAECFFRWWISPVIWMPIFQHELWTCINHPNGFNTSLARRMSQSAPTLISMPHCRGWFIY